MNADELIKVLNFIFVAGGVPKSKLLARWGVFAYPFWNNTGSSQVGFKVMAYMGVDSSRTRIAKACINHGLNCLTGALGANLSGVGALGSGVGTAGGKFGGLKDSFGVDIGAVQLSTILESGDASPLDIANAITASGKMVYFAVIRVDKADVGHRIHFRGESSPTGYSEWSVKNIKSIDTNSKKFSVWPNGIIHEGVRIIGNYKTGKKV